MINKNTLEAINFLSQKINDERNFAFNRLNNIINHQNLSVDYIVKNMDSIIKQIALLDRKSEIISDFINQIVSQTQNQQNSAEAQAQQQQ